MPTPEQAGGDLALAVPVMHGSLPPPCHARRVADLANTPVDLSLLRRALGPYSLIYVVPYTALPIVVVLSVDCSIPILMRRKEAKAHSSSKSIEVSFLIIEDLITSGSSMLETAALLHVEGLVVADAIVVVNPEQGNRKNLTANGITLHSLMTLIEFLK
jgi:uridine monophosphate synthetase